MFYDHIAQFYKDQFDLSEEERAKLVRSFTKDKKGRQIYDIKPGDKFIADIDDGCFTCSYLVMTTEKTFEVFPGQDFFGMVILEDHHTQGVIPYVLYASGDKIAMQDDDDKPWAMLGPCGVLIDDPSICNDYDTWEKLKGTVGFQYWYRAYGVNSFNHLEKAGFTVPQIYEMNKTDPRLRRWEEAMHGHSPKKPGRKRQYVKKTLPDSVSFIRMIRRKFRDIEYDEETKSLCF